MCKISKWAKINSLHNQFTNQIPLSSDGKDQWKHTVNVANPVCGNEMKWTTLKLGLKLRICFTLREMAIAEMPKTCMYLLTRLSFAVPYWQPFLYWVPIFDIHPKPAFRLYKCIRNMAPIRQKNNFLSVCRNPFDTLWILLWVKKIGWKFVFSQISKFFKTKMCFRSL